MFHQFNNGFFVTHNNLNLCQVDNTILTFQPSDAIASNSKDGNRILVGEKLRMQKQQ
ncbi:MAG: hypothetical protein ACYTXA_07680 [Nostoc sp.]